MWQFLIAQFDKISFRRAFLRFPIIGPIFHFNLRHHKEALFQAVVLWMFSFLPIFFAAGMTNTPPGNEAIWYYFTEAIEKQFREQSQFVYAATFIPPFLYIVIAQFMEVEGGIKKKINTSLRSVFAGYRLIWVLAIFSLIVMAVTFGANQNESSSKTIIVKFVSQYSFSFYLISVYVWYLSILESTLRADPDFVERARRREQEMVDGLAARMAGKGDGQ